MRKLFDQQGTGGNRRTTIAHIDAARIAPPSITGFACIDNPNDMHMVPIGAALANDDPTSTDIAEHSRNDSGITVAA